MTGYHLAEINVGRLKAPVDHPMIADFKNNLDRINALADGMPGFVWRLVGEGNNATDIQPRPDDPLFAVNMSVWTDMDALAGFVYRTVALQSFGNPKRRTARLAVRDQLRLNFRRESVCLRNAIPVRELNDFQTVLAVSEICKQAGVGRGDLHIIQIVNRALLVILHVDLRLFRPFYIDNHQALLSG